MAKTRMKTTPTRIQKDALMASAATGVTITKPPTITATATTRCHTAQPLDEVKQRQRQAPVLHKPITHSVASTIIMTAPKRTNSISSIASTISQTSDAHSDTESPPPPQSALTVSKAKTEITKCLLSTNSTSSSQAPRTLNSLLQKQPNTISALRNRKVFMITEKSDDTGKVESSTSAIGSSAHGQKRKMYLIMEEDSGAENEVLAEGGIFDKDANKKYLKRENGLIVGAGGSKKLTLFADKTDSGALTEKFEKILPEILNRIQSKDVNGGAVATTIPKLMTTPKLEPVPIVTPPKLETLPKLVTASKLMASTPKLETIPKPATTPKLETMPKLTTTTVTPIPIATMATTKLLNGNVNLNIVKTEPINAQTQHQLHHGEYNKKTTEESTTERLPITLPPKKNRTKIITNINNTSSSYHNSNNNIVTAVENSNGNANNNKIGAQCQIKQISAATPVIVSAVTVTARNNNPSSYSTPNDTKRLTLVNNTSVGSANTNIKYAANGRSQTTNKTSTSMAQVEVVPRNINLSADFHFLMDMLPKLESIPEPHKTNVKNCIEKIITQNANIFVKK